MQIQAPYGSYPLASSIPDFVNIFFEKSQDDFFKNFREKYLFSKFICHAKLIDLPLLVGWKHVENSCFPYLGSRPAKPYLCPVLQEKTTP